MTYGEKIAAKLVTTEQKTKHLQAIYFAGEHICYAWDWQMVPMIDRMRLVIAREIDAARKNAVTKERKRKAGTV